MSDVATARRELPFALRQHVPAEIDPQTSYGDLDQPWNWTPTGPVNKDDLPGYAMSTPYTQTNTRGVADRGEYQ